MPQGTDGRTGSSDVKVELPEECLHQRSLTFAACLRDFMPVKAIIVSDDSDFEASDYQSLHLKKSPQTRPVLEGAEDDLGKHGHCTPCLGTAKSEGASCDEANGMVL